MKTYGNLSLPEGTPDRPLVTFAWRDKVEYTPWPAPGAWRSFQQIGLKQP